MEITPQWSNISFSQFFTQKLFFFSVQFHTVQYSTEALII